VSVRAIARRVGVTTPAIYLHFSDKERLMRAVVGDAFAELDRALHDATRDATAPADRLLACGQTYVAFALKRAQYYRLGFTSDSVCTSAPGDPVRVVFDFLKPLVDDYVVTRPESELDPVTLTLELWATAHGLASLLIIKPPLASGDIPALVERTLCAVLRGVDATQ
jgi:AcrR family transcriptional regulator